MTCAALATGMKCLPASKIPLTQGIVLHDCHAEILALRAFNRFLIDECRRLANTGPGGHGMWLRWREERKNGDGKELKQQQQQQPFALQDDVRIHMYCSEAPCGDASMELTMATQEDATPWDHQQPEEAADSLSDAPQLVGRGHFDQLGIVRRKPARGDAPLTLSKSCSDKLALKQCTGVLSGLTSLLVHPEAAYLSTLVLPASQYVPHAVERAFAAEGRLKPVTTSDVQQRWVKQGYAFRPFRVCMTQKEFAFSKRSTDATSPSAPVPSNLSALYTPNTQEVLINGVLQGRKQFDPKGASCVSRRSLWKNVLQVAKCAEMPALVQVLRGKSFAEVKRGPELEGREMVKREVREIALEGWTRNEGDEEWSLDDADE